MSSTVSASDRAQIARQIDQQQRAGRRVRQPCRAPPCESRRRVGLYEIVITGDVAVNVTSIRIADIANGIVSRCDRVRAAHETIAKQRSHSSRDITIDAIVRRDADRR